MECIFPLSCVYVFVLQHFVTNSVYQRVQRVLQKIRKQSESINKFTNLSFHIFLLITFIYQLSHHLTHSDSYHSSYLYKFPSQKMSPFALNATSFELKYKRDVLCSHTTSTNTDSIKKTQFERK